MDKSQEYILMCEKAEEIQELYPEKKEWREGDVYAYWDSYHHYEGIYPNGKHITDWSIRISSMDGEYGLDKRSGKFVWLPRQDQLQEIYLSFIPFTDPDQYIPIFIREIFNFTMSISGKSGKHIKSMEQLWLAFVMKEKYRKSWNGEKWIGILKEVL